MSESLHAPWRIEYIRSLEKPAAPDACFVCDAAKASTDAERRSRFVLWATELSVVIINIFPYTNGHLLVAPKAHKPDLELLTPEETNDMQAQTTAAVKLLKRAISPQGFNIGINLGRCAGAGVPGHIHQHVVPRWSGDTNFMPVLADVKVIPEHLLETRDRLRDAWRR
jgi:ATP adenylyltransferase